MIDIIKYVLFAILAASCLASAYFSIRSRRMGDPADRGLNGALMNINMGIMLLALSIIAMLLFKGSTPAVIVEAAFMVLGAFNIFAGIRTRSFYARQKAAKL